MEDITFAYVSRLRIWFTSNLLICARFQQESLWGQVDDQGIATISRWLVAVKRESQGQSDSLAAVYCPRCGTENQPGNRYCIECGSGLSKAAASSTGAPMRTRFRRMFGSTRRARLLSAGTIVAIALAIGAFVALKPSSESGQDAFIRSLDKACLEEKERIAALERQATAHGPAGVAAFATSLTALVEEWRLSLARNPPPPSHVGDVRVLDSKLREVLIEAGALARVARQGNPRQIVAGARSVDEATKSADRAMEELGLSNCSEFKIGTSGS